MTAPRLLLLTDRSQLRLGRSLRRTVRECVDAGLSHVVVREHDLSAPARAALLADLAAVPSLTVISSRLPDPSAHGVHLAAGQPVPATCNAPLSTLPRPHEGAPVGVTERYMWHARSCHTLEEVRRAAGEGAAYVTLSPFALTASKPGYGPVIDPAVYAEAATTGVPVLALGGIDAHNAPAALAAGAHGVAVMGSVMRADDPAQVVADLLAALAAEAAA